MVSLLAVGMDPFFRFLWIIILNPSHAFDNLIRQPTTCKVVGLIWLPFLLDPPPINQSNGDGSTDMTTCHSLVALETLLRELCNCQWGKSDFGNVAPSPEERYG